MMNSNTKFLGTSDENTVCECCGKKNLKSTVALSIDDADPVYFGVTCAARALKVGVKEVRTANRAADIAKAAADRAEREALHRARFGSWSAWLETKSGLKGDVFRAIEKLGGYGAANAAYEAEVASVKS